MSFPHIMWNFIATSNDIGKIVKLAFIISSGTFWGQSSSNEKLFRFSISLDLSKKTLGRNVISASQALRRTFWGRTEFWKDLFFQFGWMTLVEFRTAIYMSRKTFLATLFWIINLLFSFSDFEHNNCENFTDMLSAIISELSSMCTEEQIEKKTFSWKMQNLLILSGL